MAEWWQQALGVAVPGYGLYQAMNAPTPTAEELGMGYLQQGLAGLQQGQADVMAGIQEGRAGLQDLAGATAGYQPYAQAGLGALQAGLGGYQQLLQQPGQLTPGGEFALSRGIEAAERGAAAGGTQLSGGQLETLQGIGMGVAQQDLQQQLQNQMQLAQFGGQMGMGAQGQMLQNQQLMQQLGLGYTQLGAQTGLGFQEGMASMYGGMAQLQSEAGMLPWQQRQNMLSGLFNIGGQATGAAIGGA